jgi:hypothetical protein
LEQLLRRHGATNVITASGDDPPAALVQFNLAGRLIRFVRPYEGAAVWSPAKRQADRRRVWRVLILWAKARLEAIDGGDSTAEAEFMHWIALPTGMTVGEWLKPQLADAYSVGRMPALLLPSGGDS